MSGTLKWLFGGPGTAFLRVRPALDDALRPTTTGWFSSARQFAFAVDELELAADGRRYELGTPSVPSAAIARGGTELVREIGVDRLGERTRDLGELLIALADEAGLAVRAVRDPDRRGGIVAVAVDDPKPVVDALAAEGIIVDFRPGIVRCSPAFYNTEDEVRLLVERLAAHVARVEAPSAELEEPEAMGNRGGFGPPRHAELAEDVADVHAGRALGHEQLVPDLTVAAPVGEHGEDLPLARRQAQAVGRVLGRVDALEADARTAGQ